MMKCKLERMFDQLSLTDLKDKDGLTKLLEFLDKHLAKAELTDSLEKFEDFDDFTRTEGQIIEKFITMFDAEYWKIEDRYEATI